VTALADLRLVCVAPDTVVPPANGSAARTFGLATAVRPHLGSVTICAFSASPAPVNLPAGVEVVHLRRPAGGPALFVHRLRMLLGRTLGFRFAAPLAGDGVLVQLESPLLFEAARRVGLRHFVLDAHNVYQDLGAFPQASLGDRVLQRLTLRRQARIESACWAAAAHVVFCSTVDRNRAVELAPGVAAKSTVVPNCVDTRGFSPRPAPAFTEDGPVVFTGTTRYPPNYFAVEEICRALAPALPGLPFWIVGDAPYRPSQIPDNVRFVGRVDSTAALLAGARVALAPIRHGSGTRFKLLEYFAAGLPVVCTAKAAEGLAVEDGRHVRLAETAGETVEAIRAVHADARASAALGAAARRLVEQRYDWRVHVPALLSVYASLGR
jgi:glycosyltransferase involved in cell wall biosynthesis